MAAKKQTSGTFTVNTMDESVTHEVRLSSASVRFSKSGDIVPSSIKANAVAVSSADGVTDFIGFMVAKNALGSTIAYSSTSPLASSFVIDGSILRSAVYPITVNLYISPSSTSTPIASVSIQKVEDGDKGDKGDKGEDGITVHVRQPVVAIQTDEFGKPTENALYKEITFDIYKGGTLVEDATVLAINGVQTVQTINGVSLTRSGNKILYSYYTFNAVTPFVCKVEVMSASLDVNRVCDISFSVVSKGAVGATGKMGRNPYFAGKWDDISTFVVTDYQTPFVEVTDANGKSAFYVFVGANGTYSKSSAGTPGSSSNWILMTTDFKYLISEAIFSEFAKLGSGIFNKDFMFSQHGTLVYGNIGEASQAYQLADPSDMGAAKSIIWEKESLEMENASVWSETNKTGGFALEIGRKYVLKGIAETGNAPLYLRVSTSATKNVNALTVTGKQTIEFVFTPDVSGVYYLYYNLPPNTTATLTNLSLISSKFRPNVYVDWLKGFIYAQTGKFKDIIIEGVMNNLITEIDETSDKIIKYSWTDSSNNKHTEYCLDVLRCGNVVRIKSLPADIQNTSGNQYKYLNLPYFVSAGEYQGDPVCARTHTRLNVDGTVSSTSRPITADEMRMLVGRKLCLIFDFYNQSLTNVKMPAFGIMPSSIANESERFSDLKNAVIAVANGNPHINSTDVSNLLRRDVSLGVNRTVWMECRMVRDNNTNQAVYVWTTNYTETNGIEVDELDECWGG